MIEINIKFDRMVLAQICDTLQGLRSRLNINEISDNEESAHTSLDSLNISNILEYAKGNSSGFILYSPRAEYHISYADFGDCSLYVLMDNFQESRNFVLEMSKIDLLYGYACLPEEREHRNRVVINKDYGQHQAWVGRNFRKWLPGLYWINIIPENLVKAHNLNIDNLFDFSEYKVEKKFNNYIIECYADPSEWVRQTEKIDRICSETEGIFSKSEAVLDIVRAKSYMETSEKMGRWS